MEKINTPLGEFNSIINTELFQLNDQLDRVWDPSEVSKLKREIKLLDKLQERLKSLLPTERDVIEKAYDAGTNQEVRCVANGKGKKCYCTNEINCQHKYLVTPKDYFTQTFKSYG